MTYKPGQTSSRTNPFWVRGHVIKVVCVCIIAKTECYSGYRYLDKKKSINNYSYNLFLLSVVNYIFECFRNTHLS